MAPLRRHFGPQELKLEMDAAGVTGAVSVQARSSLEETEWLLAIAAEHDFILGVVGWIDLASPGVGGDLDRYACRRKFKGVREVCQGAPDEQFFANRSFNDGIRALTERSLTYDLLIYSNQLATATTFVDRHPNQQFVVDHCAKPEIAGGDVSARWRRDISELARRPQVACKLSGLVTEIRDEQATFDAAVVRPYLDAALEAFGPERLMIGSDWPVLALRSTYGAWMSEASRWLTGYSESISRVIRSETARRVYGLA